MQREDVNIAALRQLYFECSIGRSLYVLKTPKKDKPETIKWLNKMSERISLWNVGASIWLCTLCMAKTKKAKVLVFEPSSKSFLALMNNGKLNSFGDEVIPCFFALNEKDCWPALILNR